MEAIKALLAPILDGTRSGRELETWEIEFKTDGRSLHDDLANLAEAAACMANAQGGTIIVGVDDRIRGPEALLGTRLDPEKTRHRLYEITSPPLLIDAASATVGPARILALRIARSTQVHSANGKIPSERVDDHCVPMSTERIANVTAQKIGRDWSASDSAVPAAHIDPHAVQAARDMLSRSADPSRRRRSEASDIDLLRGVGVVTEHQTLTNAGALLFSHAFDERVLVTYTHRRTPAGQLSANEQLPGPLTVAIARVFDLIEARLETTPVSIGRGQQLHIADLPEAAIREAIVNGVMHRDYFPLEATAVEHAATRLRVSSPGGFVPGVNVDNVLTTSSRTRNHNLANALRSLGLAETAGSGVDRMYAEMTRVGHEPPRYVADPTKVEVTLLGGAPNSALARYVSTLPTDEAEDADTMLILLTLLTHRTVDAVSLTPLLQKPSSSEAQSVLTRLSGDEIKLLEPTRETARRAQPKYRLRESALSSLGTAISYRRRTVDQLDRKIVEYVDETGTINGRMVRLLLDLDTMGASRLLSDMVERGLLVKSSVATRGPSVTYGKGPVFPGRPQRRKPKKPTAG